MKSKSKKIISLLLTLAWLLVFVKPVAAASYNMKFANSEVFSTKGFYPEVEWVLDHKWMTLNNGVFLAEKQVTKGELAVILSRLTGKINKLQKPQKPTFSDVPPTHPYYAYIETMKYCLPYQEKEGSDYRTRLVYEPNQPVTVQEAVYAAIKALEFKKDEWNIPISEQLKLAKKIQDEQKIVDMPDPGSVYFPFMYICIKYELLQPNGVGVEKIINGKREIVYTYFCTPYYNITKLNLAELLFHLTIPVAKNEEDVFKIYSQAFKNAESRVFMKLESNILSIEADRIFQTLDDLYSHLFSTTAGGSFSERSLLYEINYDSVPPEKIRETFKKAQEIVKEIIKPGMTNTEKVKAIHDYIIENVTYDWDTARGKKQNKESFTAYGALINGKAVCQGYAGAFVLLAQMAGIPALFVFGLTDYGLHGWNMVYINGEVRYIDVTFDDSSPDGKIPLYDYFLLTAEQMELPEKNSHKWSKNFYTKDKFKYVIFCDPPKIK